MAGRGLSAPRRARRGSPYAFDVNYGAPSSETLQAYLPDGTSPWTQTTTVFYAVPLFAEQLVVDENGNAVVAGDFNGSVADGGALWDPTTPTPSGTGFQAFDSTGHLLSTVTWSGSGPNSHFGAVALDPQGNVLLAGTIGPGQATTSIFLAKLAR
jgi:hypothetical protein